MSTGTLAPKEKIDRKAEHLSRFFESAGVNVSRYGLVVTLLLIEIGRAHV